MIHNTKNRINNTITDIRLLFINTINNKQYYFPVIFYSVLTYGFNIFNRTVSIDDLNKDLYCGSGKLMLASTRWAHLIWNRLFSTLEFTPYIDKLFGLIMLILSSIMILVIYYKITNCNNVWAYTIFSCLFITFSLNNEIWEYTGASTALYGGIIFSAFTVLYLIEDNPINIIDILLSGILLSIPISAYESSIFVYISLVAFTLLFITLFKDKNYSWIKNVWYFIIPLIIAFILRYLIGFLFIYINNISYVQNGDTSIYWLSLNFADCINKIYENILTLYIYNAKFYPPITLFLLSTLAYGIIVLFKSKNINTLIISILAYISIFFLCILRGGGMAYRYSQPIQYFVSTIGFICIYLSSDFNIKYLYKVVIVLFMIICLRQGIYCHQVLALNNQRSENEARIVNYIGTNLYTNYDLNKDVIFCGQYHLGDYIERQISTGSTLESEYIDTDVNSCLNWTMKNQQLIKDYFSYYGFDINVRDFHLDKAKNKEYEKIAKDNNMKPLTIKDLGDYILVYLGEIED